MGIYLNPGNTMFRQALRSKIYVDKTGLIAYANEVLDTEQKNICVSRPRRFGKSMAAHMLCAYYDRTCDSRAMFSGLKIAEDPSFEEHLNQYDVIFLNIQNFVTGAKNIDEVIAKLEKEVLRDIKEAYPFLKEEWMEDLPHALEHVYAEKQTGFIFILDEWDCLFRLHQRDMEAQKSYLDFLRLLLKDRRYVKLAYMTGILPIKKYGVHSALNMFEEFSMTDPAALAEFVGFTEDEVKTLCVQYQFDFVEMQNWYDGYCFDKNLHVYNPKSVVDAIRRKRFGSYWTSTETYEALKIYIDMDFNGLRHDVVKMIAGERCRVNPMRFQNDMTTFTSKDDVLTLLVHLGYLAYDSVRREVFIPNEEVRGEFINAVEASQWDEVIKAVSASEALLEATINGDTEAVAKGIDAVHMESVSMLEYNNENALSCVVTLAYYTAREFYTMIRELPTGKGFADIVFLPRKNAGNRPAMIVELKWNQAADTAIEQIKRKQYVKALEAYQGNILLVGISYDKTTKEHTCVIETIEI